MSLQEVSSFANIVLHMSDNTRLCNIATLEICKQHHLTQLFAWHGNTLASSAYSKKQKVLLQASLLQLEFK